MGYAFHAGSFVLSFLGISGAISIALVFYLARAYHQHPSDLVLAIGVSDFFLATRFFVRSVAWLVHPRIYTPVRSMHIFSDRCTSSIVWASFFENSSLAWNAVWCFNLIVQLKYPSRNTRNYLKFYHLYAWTVATLMTVLYLSVGSYGAVHIGEYVFCGELDRTLYNPVIAVQFAFTLSQLAVGLASGYIGFRTLHLIRGSESARLLKLHSAYVLVFFVLWFGQALVTVVPVPVRVHQIVSLLWQAQAFFVALIRLHERDLINTLLKSLRFPEDFVNTLWPLAPPEQRHDLLEGLLSQAPEEDAASAYASWGAGATVVAELEVADSLGTNSNNSKRNRQRQRERAATFSSDQLQTDI